MSELFKLNFRMKKGQNQYQIKRQSCTKRVSSQQSHTFRSRIVQAKRARHSNMILCKFNANYLQVFQQYAVCSNTGLTVINMVFCVHPRLVEATPREIHVTPVRVTVSNFTTSKKRWVLMKVNLFIYSNTISPLTACQKKNKKTSQWT